MTEFRFPADFSAWVTYTAQGVYTNVPISQIKRGCERPLVVRLADDMYAAIAEARLVDYARMKLSPLVRSVPVRASGERVEGVPPSNRGQDARDTTPHNASR